MTTEVIVAIYEPPASGLPYLAVAIVSNEVVYTLATETAEEARTLMDRVGDELSRNSTGVLRPLPCQAQVSFSGPHLKARAIPTTAMKWPRRHSRIVWGKQRPYSKQGFSCAEGRVLTQLQNLLCPNRVSYIRGPIPFRWSACRQKQLVFFLSLQTNTSIIFSLGSSVPP